MNVNLLYCLFARGKDGGKFSGRKVFWDRDVPGVLTDDEETVRTGVTLLHTESSFVSRGSRGRREENLVQDKVSC